MLYRVLEPKQFTSEEIALLMSPLGRVTPKAVDSTNYFVFEDEVDIDDVLRMNGTPVNGQRLRVVYCGRYREPTPPMDHQPSQTSLQSPSRFYDSNSNLATARVQKCQIVQRDVTSLQGQELSQNQRREPTEGASIVVQEEQPQRRLNEQKSCSSRPSIERYSDDNRPKRILYPYTPDPDHSKSSKRKIKYPRETPPQKAFDPPKHESSRMIAEEHANDPLEQGEVVDQVCVPPQLNVVQTPTQPTQAILVQQSPNQAQDPQILQVSSAQVPISRNQTTRLANPQRQIRLMSGQSQIVESIRERSSHMKQGITELVQQMENIVTENASKLTSKATDDKQTCFELLKLKAVYLRECNKVLRTVGHTIGQSMEYLASKQLSIDLETNYKHFNSTKNYCEIEEWATLDACPYSYLNVSNPVKKLLAVSPSQFIASVQNKEIKIYDKNGINPHMVVQTKHPPYGICMGEDLLMVGDKTGGIKLLNLSELTFIPEEFRAGWFNDTICQILREGNCNFSLSRLGFVTVFTTAPYSRQNSEEPYFRQLRQLRCQVHCAMTMSLMSASHIVAGTNHSIERFELEKGVKTYKDTTTRINKIIKWEDKVMGYCSGNSVHFWDLRMKDSSSTCNPHISSNEISTMQVLAKNIYGFGSYAEFGVVDVRMAHTPLLKKAGRHSNFIKDIIMLDDQVVTGGTDSVICPWIKAL